MPLRKTILADHFYRLIEHRILPRLDPFIESPNQFTMLGLGIAIIVPFGFYVHPFFGLLFILLSSVSDAIDGLVARRRGLNSEFGAFLDSSIDRISDFFYLFGFWTLFWEEEWLVLASALIFFSLIFTFMISYTKARAESLGCTCEKGFMERGVRILYLLIWALLICIRPSAAGLIRWAGLFLFIVLTLSTVIQRMVHIRAQLKYAKQPPRVVSLR